MKRIIIDFKKLDNQILELLVSKYPDGYGDDDIITFKNVQGEIIDCVEIRTAETIYLVKISKRLVEAMDDFEVDHDSGDKDDFDSDSEMEMTPEKIV